MQNPVCATRVSGSSRILVYTACVLLLCLVNAQAASVTGNGYTNDFSARPAAADFSTSGGISGGSGDVSTADGLDTAVQTVVASSLTAQVTDASALSPNNPPAKQANAMWTSAGGAYLVTRSTGNKATLLMATLVNNTGTNCNLLHFNYQLTVGASVTEEVPSQRLYYSFSGAASSWVALPAVSGLNSSQLINADVPLSQTWNNGATLYLLWADDNAADSTESAYEIDNFFASTYYTNMPLSVTLTSPTAGQHIGAGTMLNASVALTGSPANVNYYVDGLLVTNRAAAPFSPVTLPAQSMGAHTLYATAQDTNGALVTTATNAFVVDMTLSGTLAGDTTLYASNGSYTISANLTIPAGVTLTIEPGVTLQLASNVRIIAYGRLVAAGDAEHRIRFTRSSTANWSGLFFSGNHQSNILAYADIEYANASGNAGSPANGSAVVYVGDSQLTIDRCTFFNIAVKYFDIWYPQFNLRHSVFGNLGGVYFGTVENMYMNGWFIVDGNLFGLDTGDNDIWHLNHISLKNGPVAQIVNNVFTGAGDDHIDDNESDSHIEGNLFMNFTTNHPPRSASAAVTTGEGSGSTSVNLHVQRLTVVRNIFWGCDYAIINKDGSAVQIYNCVFVNNRGGIIFDEPWRTDSGPGRSCYIENSIFWKNAPDNGVDQGPFAYLTNSAAYTSGRYYQGATQVTVNNSILPSQYHYLGTNNFDADPMFVFPTNLMSLSPTNPAFAKGFDGFDANAFLLTNHLIPDTHLLPGSPAIGVGFNGSDLGIYVSDDATVTGEPASPTTNTTATLTVGGLDMIGYKYRLVSDRFTNDWSPELQGLNYVYSNSISGTRATAYCTGHGFSNGDTVQIMGADSLCPYYNGTFSIYNVGANSFDYTVNPGTNLITSEPLSINWPIRNEHATDEWCRKLQNIELGDLPNGTYHVEVVRKNTMGLWQNTNAPTISKSWTVNMGGQTGPRLTYTYSSNVISLRFQAKAGQAYQLQYSDSLNPANWQRLVDIPAPSIDGEVGTTDTNPVTTRFYRIYLQ